MSPPANIMLVNHTSRMSGAERGLIDIVAGLDSTRFAPTVVLPEPGDLSETFRHFNVPVEFLPLKRFKRTLWPLTLASYLVSVRNVGRGLVDLIRNKSITLVHANSDTAQIYSGPAAQQAGVPSIWHSRDLVPLGRFGKRMARRASRIIATSEAVAEHLRACRPAEGRVTTIHNAVDLNMFSPVGRRRATRRELGIDEETFLVATIGQLVPWKRHADFIAAARLLAEDLPNAQFLIVGSDLFNDSPEYVAHLKRLADTSGIADRITFAAQRTDMPALLEAVDLVIHPACREPFGRAVAEAMAMARPVIAVNACGPVELIDSGVTGILVPPESPRAMADAAAGVAGDPARARTIGAAARAHIEKNFAMPGFIAKLQSIYKEVCGLP